MHNAAQQNEFCFANDNNKIKMGVIDYDLIKGLTHRTLAKHVFPWEYYGTGHNSHTGRMVCVNQIVEDFKVNMKLNVQIAFRKWETTEFLSLRGLQDAGEDTPVARENISRKNCCTLYCKDCKAVGVCCPVARVSFYGDLDSDVEEGAERNCSARVTCLYFHNSHSWHFNAKLMLAAGFCDLEMSRVFIAGDTYYEAIKQGRILLHEEKGTKANSKLGKKEPGNYQFPFTYLPGQTDNNLAQMMASNCHPEDWSKRLPRLIWDELVDPDSHVSNMVRLYYCVSVQLGISRIASPFDIHYTDNWLMAGSDPNPEYDSFMQEETVLVGGFVNSGPNVCQPRHMYYSMHEIFLPSGVNLKGMADGSHLFKHGFTMMMSLVEGEERSLYVGHPDSKMQVYKDHVLVLLGNVPRGGVTVAVDRDSDHIWPALHVHMDRKGKPREPNTVVEVPLGYGFHDNNSSGVASILADSDPSNGTPVRESIALLATRRNSTLSGSGPESIASPTPKRKRASSGSDSERIASPTSKRKRASRGSDSESTASPAPERKSASSGSDSESTIVPIRARKSVPSGSAPKRIALPTPKQKSASRGSASKTIALPAPERKSASSGSDSENALPIRARKSAPSGSAPKRIALPAPKQKSASRGSASKTTALPTLKRKSASRGSAPERIALPTPKPKSASRGSAPERIASPTPKQKSVPRGSAPESIASPTPKRKSDSSGSASHRRSNRTQSVL